MRYRPEEVNTGVAAFLEAVKERWNGWTVMLGTDEDCFSWSQCDGCGSRYGGTRHEAFAWPREGGSMLKINICNDCAHFHANNEKPQSWRQHP